MFDKSVYKKRREALVSKMSKTAAEGSRGVVLFLGNVDSPAQYADNAYKFRQNSSWLYYFGIDSPRFAAIMDLDSGEETIYSDDFSIDDIIWTGPQPSVQSIAESVGVANSAPYAAMDEAIAKAQAAGRNVHCLPQTRYYNIMKLEALKISSPSELLTKAVIEMRLIKEDIEIAEIDKACNLGYAMHTIARKGIKPGIIEQEIVGAMEGFCLSKAWGTSFATILTQHGEIFHNHSHDCIIEPGKLMVIDAGVESNTHYASDFTRTYPTSGKFTNKQREIYQIVCDCNNHAYSIVKPGIAYRDVHLSVASKMLEGLSALDLVHGDIETMVNEGVAGLFMPHGLGHNMGIDVHDMEDLGENLVGYDNDQKRSSLPGLRSLRMARKLVPGHVITNEPGIYFIPALIENWKKDGKAASFINYKKLEDYYDFGGIRLEDDLLVTAEGVRRLGDKRLPITANEVEEAMAND